MSSINTNVTAMAAIRSLSMINNNMQTTQARVESGLRINKANDDPAVFAIAQTMRADLKGLEAVRDSLAFGKATLTVARDAATKISDELARLKQTVTQGQQQGIDATTVQNQINQALQNINAYARSATFNGVNLLDANAASSPANANLNVITNIRGSNSLTVNNQNGTVADLALTGLQLNQGGVRVTFATGFDVTNNEVFAIRAQDGARYVFEFTDGSTTLTTQPRGDNPTTTFTNEMVKVIQVQYDSDTQTPFDAIAALANAIRDEGFGATLNTSGGGFTLDITGAINAAATVAPSLYDGTIVPSTRIGDGAGAAATVAIITGATAGNTAIAAVDNAITTINETLANLGASIRQVEGLLDYNKQLTDSLKEGLGALVDADLAEESARLTSLQTKQQLAIQSLAIANQQGQALLGLFR
jgi:flagellin